MGGNYTIKQVIAISTKTAVATILLLGTSIANAADLMEYKKIAQDTVDQAKSGRIADIDFLIEQQSKLVDLGVQASNEYAAKHPKAKKALEVVTSKAGQMKQLSLMEIEEHWHSGKELEKNGINLHRTDHFGSVHSLMDAIIHPATSYIALKEYKKTRDPAHLEQVVAELEEVLEHVSHIKD